MAIFANEQVKVSKTKVHRANLKKRKSSSVITRQNQTVVLWGFLVVFFTWQAMHSTVVPTETGKNSRRQNNSAEFSCSHKSRDWNKSTTKNKHY